MATSLSHAPAKKRFPWHLLTHDRLLGFLIGLSLIPIWITRYSPLQDYPEWLLQAQILRHLNDPALDFAAHYTAFAAPIPNAGSIVLIYLLSFLAPIEIAGKLALSCYVIALPLAVAYFLRAIQTRPTALEYLGVLLVYNYFLYMGYVSYLFGLALLIALLGYLWRRDFQPAGGGWLVLALGSVALFLTHLIPWVTLWFVCVSYISLWRKRFGARQLLLLAAACAPALILLVLYGQISAGALVIMPYPRSLPWYKIGSYFEPLVLAPSFRPWSNVAPPLLINGGVLIGGGVAAALALRTARQQARDAGVALLNPTPLLIAAGLAVMIAILPYWFGGLVRPDERLTIPAALLTLAAVRWPRPRRSYDAGLALIVSATLILHAATFVRGGNEMARLVNDLAPHVGRDEHPYFLRVPGGCAPILAEDWLPIIEPGPRAGFYLTIAAGGANRQIFDTGLVRPKTPIPFENRMLWYGLFSDLEAQLPALQAEVFPAYDALALSGCPELVQRVAAQLAPAFTVTADPTGTRSPYLLLLRRADLSRP